MACWLLVLALSAAGPPAAIDVSPVWVGTRGKLSSRDVRVWWAAAGSPVLHPVGEAGQVALPSVPTGGVVVLVRALGCLPAARHVPEAALRRGTVSLTVRCRAATLELLPRLGDWSGLATDGPDVPDPRFDGVVVPAADGGGVFVSRRVMAEPPASWHRPWPPWFDLSKLPPGVGGPGPDPNVPVRSEVWWVPFGPHAQRLDAVWVPASDSVLPELATSPDGRWVAWSRGYEGHYELLVCRRDGQGMRRVAGPSTREVNHPAWLADGGGVLYVERVGGGCGKAVTALLREAAWDGSHAQTVTGFSVEPWGQPSQPVPAPDGREVALVEGDGLSVFDLRTGACLRQSRLRPPAAAGAIAWSPDGRTLAVLSRALEPPGAGDVGETAVYAWDTGKPGLVALGDRFTWWAGNLPCGTGPALLVGTGGKLAAFWASGGGGDPLAAPARLRDPAWMDGEALLAVREDEERAEVVRLRAGQLEDLTRGFAGRVWEAVPHGRDVLAIAGPYRGLRGAGEGTLWRVRPGGGLTPLSDPLPGLRSLSVTAEGRAAALMDWPPSVQLRWLDTLEPVARVPGDVEGAAVSPAGGHVALDLGGGRLAVLAVGGALTPVPGVFGPKVDLHWLPDGSAFRPSPEAPWRITVEGRVERCPVEQLVDTEGSRRYGRRVAFTPMRAPGGRYLAALNEGDLWLGTDDAPARRVYQAKPMPRFPLLPTRPDLEARP